MQKKIILVESEPKLVDIYRRFFQKTDFDVEHAAKIDDMLEELRAIRTGASRRPDLVLLDFVMADGDGMEVLRAMKKSVLTRDIPVFAVTNYQNPDIDRQMRESGIMPEKYLIKAHYTPRQLVDLVSRHFNQDEGPMTTLS